MKTLLSTICTLGFFGSFIALIGIAGGIDCESISISTGAFGVAGCLAVLGLSVAGIIKIQKDEEENIYDRL